MTKARTNASVAPAVGRNMVINGAMNVAQRATSLTGGGNASGYFTCDRWKIETGNSAGRFTMTQTADGPNGISANCLKMDCTTADTSIAAGEFLQIHQLFEGQNVQRIGKGVAGAKQITVSFYVKANASLTFCLEIRDSDHSRQISKLFTTTTDWVRHEFTIAADEDDGSSPFADDNAQSLKMTFWLHAGSTFTSGTLNTATFANSTNGNRAVGMDSFYSSTDNNFFLTGVQLEVGPVATEFEQEDIGVTKNKCLRYFTRIDGGKQTYYAFQYHSGHKFMIIQHPVEMRATPSATLTFAGGSMTAYNLDRKHYKAYISSEPTDSTSHYISEGAWDAEL